MYKAGLVSSLQRARETDIQEAKAYIQNKASGKGEADKETEEQWTGKQWCVKDVQAALYSNPLDCLVLIDNFVVDVTAYLGEHVSTFNSVVKLVLREGSLEGELCSGSMQ